MVRTPLAEIEVEDIEAMVAQLHAAGAHVRKTS